MTAVREATVKSRRGAALLAPVVVGIAWLACGCQAPPSTSLQIAKLALASASSAGATRYAEPDYRAAEMLVQSGWLEIGRQNGKLAPFRNYAVAETVLSQAAQMANRAAHVSEERSRSVESQARREYAALEAALTNYRQSLDHSLAAYSEQRFWSQASLALQTSMRLMGRGEFGEARAELDRGQFALKQLGGVMTRRANEEAAYVNVWRHWVSDTVAESRAGGSIAVIVDKSDHATYVVRGGRLVESYPCDLSYNSAQQKLVAGDAATPEGRYHVTAVKQRSRYYKALEINYPNQDDRARFQAMKRGGQIRSGARPGGLIEIHGEGGNGRDWTMGCVALSNRDMDRILRYVSVGTPVTIVRRVDNWP